MEGIFSTILTPPSPLEIPIKLHTDPPLEIPIPSVSGGYFLELHDGFDLSRNSQSEMTNICKQFFDQFLNTWSFVFHKFSVNTIYHLLKINPGIRHYLVCKYIPLVMAFF